MIGAELSSSVRTWGLALTERTGSTYSDTWFAVQGESHVVVKAGDERARSREAAALRLYNAGGAPVCELLAAARGVLLVRRILPGDDLRPLAVTDDDAATEVIGGVIVGLHEAVSHSTQPDQLPPLHTIADAFAQALGAPIPAPLVGAARALVADLTTPDSRDTVVHGDLHHRNVLRSGWDASESTWWAIDPHGWWGDPTFDAVAMLLDLHDPRLWAGLTDAEVRRRAQRRIAILSERVGLDAHRLTQWAIAGAVISELWCWEDHRLVQGWPQRLAEVLLDSA